jgi:ketosteroid isomerase-like protein
MKKYLPFLFIAGLVATCKTRTVDVSRDAEQIMNADRAFSALSETSGLKAAFAVYADSSVVLLRPGYFPIVGQAAFDYMQQQEETGTLLSWSPENAGMALCGDLGYTYGIYTLKTPDTIQQGTYVTIWQRQADGSWKFLLGSGNEGVGKNK